jgi:hypothetical protein
MRQGTKIAMMAPAAGQCYRSGGLIEPVARATSRHTTRADRPAPDGASANRASVLWPEKASSAPHASQALAAASRARSKRPYRCRDCLSSNLMSGLSAALSMLQEAMATIKNRVAKAKVLRLANR